MPTNLNVFDYADAPAPISETDEAELIEAAQYGNEAAKLDLLARYGRAIRSAVRNFGNGVAGGPGMGNHEIDIDDLQSSALVGFLALIEDHDPEQNPRLAGRVAQYLARHLAEEFSAASAFAVPPRTLARFYGILKAADGDPEVAEASAPDYDMARDTFRTIYAAVRGTGSLEGITEEATGDVYASPLMTPSPVVDVEDRILVDHAFAAMDDEEARICELAYGFTNYGEPLSDDAVGAQVGLSRLAVLRRRNKALTKSRKALGVTLLADETSRKESVA